MSDMQHSRLYSRLSARWLLAVLTFLFGISAAACGSSVRKFPEQPPIWKDDDQQSFAPVPDEYFSPFGWDAADNTVFRPIARFFAVDPAERAENVNAFDEVPDSSWFTNRMYSERLSDEALRAGACNGPPLDTESTWTITGAKPDGANPGFVMKAADGRRYIVKFAKGNQPVRATSADVVGSKIYWAAGYYAPCNEIVYFNPEILKIADDATAEDATGEEEPLTQEHIDDILEVAVPVVDGKHRASVSLFLDGIPVGPWKYEGTRDDDPNDVFDHQERRELRGMYVFAAWLNHFDSREQNTLAMFIPDDPENPDAGGHVRHNMLDFGDCFGSLWSLDGLSERLGHAYYFDISYVIFDWLTFGFVEQPWDDAGYGITGAEFGFYDVDRFRADKWKPGYPNPAFLRALEADNAWGARILALFDDDAIRAVVAAARLDNNTKEAELIRLLKGRRDKLLRRYLSVLSPLMLPKIQVTERKGSEGEDSEVAELCLEDRALRTGLWDPETRRYGVQAWNDQLEEVGNKRWRKHGDHHVCVELPGQGDSEAEGPESSASPESPKYYMVDVFTSSPDGTKPGPARVHVYHRGGTDYLVVGLERPERSTGIRLQAVR